MSAIEVQCWLISVETMINSASLNVIMDAGCSLSVIINTDLDISLEEISPT